MVDDKASRIMERLKEIDRELEMLSSIKIDTSYNWVMDRHRTHTRKVIIDRYQSQLLKSEKISLLNQLEEIGRKKAEAYCGPVTQTEEDLSDKSAISWGVGLYIARYKPKQRQSVIKRWDIAKDTVDKFYPDLKGSLRKKKIDAVRDRIVRAVKKSLRR